MKQQTFSFTKSNILCNLRKLIKYVLIIIILPLNWIRNVKHPLLTYVEKFAVCIEIEVELKTSSTITIRK